MQTLFCKVFKNPIMSLTHEQNIMQFFLFSRKLRNRKVQ